MAVTVKERTKPSAGLITGPQFRDPATMTEEELTDPDFRQRQILKDAGLNEEEVLTCTQCHHCRR